MAGSIRRLGVISTVTIALGLLAWQGIKLAPDRMLADPIMGPRLRGMTIYGPQWNEFVEAVKPIVDEFDQIGSAIDTITKQISLPIFNSRKLTADVDSRLSQLSSFESRIEGLPVKNEEIRQIREQLTHARTHQVEALNALKRFLKTRDDQHLTGPGGFVPSIEAYKQDFDKFSTLRDAYFKAHGLDVPGP